MLSSKELGNLSDRDLLAEARVYEGKLTSDPAKLNLTAADATAVKNFNDDFETKLDAWDLVQADFDAKGQAKNDERKKVLGEMRRQRNVAYADTTLTDAALADFGLPVRDTVKTASPAPTTAPMGSVDYGKLRHTINFRDSATPDKKAKPKGMQGCEIWRFIGTAPPTAESDYSYVATDSDSPYVSFFPMEDAGKKVYYLLRWLSKSGERGEWSETIEATING